MVSFRFYLVSVTAFFLALAIGIAMGATVVDRATVDLLQNRLDNVRRNSEETNRENDQLRAVGEHWEQFAAQADDRLVKGRLAGVPVVVIFLEGSDRAPLDALRPSLTSAGATLLGTLWLTNKLALSNNDDVTGLRDIADAASARPPDLRRIVASQVASALTSTSALPSLSALIDRGFARAEGAGGASIGPAGLVTEGTRFVVVADGKAAAPNPELAQPLVEELARRAPARVLAADSGRDATGEASSTREGFVGLLRANSGLRAATIDNLDQFAGRIAAVIVLQGMGEGRVGHYGVGPGASRQLPELPA
jgi:hypothetical protein